LHHHLQYCPSQTRSETRRLKRLEKRRRHCMATLTHHLSSSTSQQAPASTTVSVFCRVFYRVFLLDSPQASKATTRPARSRCLLPGPSLPPISGKCFYYYITPQYHTPRDVRPRVVTSDEAALRHTHCNLTGAISRPNRLCAVRWSGWLWSCSGPSSAEYRWRCCDLPPTHGPDSRFVRNPLPPPPPSGQPTTLFPTAHCCGPPSPRCCPITAGRAAPLAQIILFVAVAVRGC